MSGASASARSGFAVRCTTSGTVIDVLVDGVGLPVPRQLVEWFHDGDVGAVLTLLQDLSHDRLTVPWWLRVQDGDDWRRMVVTGTLDDPADEQVVVVVGAPEPEDLGGIVVAAATRLDADTAERLEVKARSAARSAPGERDFDVLGELARTGNDLANLHRELAATTVALEQANQQKDGLLAMVAHDLRNPLGSMVGFAQALKRQVGPQLEDRALMLLDRIESVGTHLLDVVDDLLDVTVVEHQQLDLDLASVDLAELVRGEVETHRDLADAKDLHFELQMPSDPAAATVVVDEGRIRQVLDNLLSNAIKYSPDGAGEAILVRVELREDEVQVHVTDQGVGIADDEQETIFAPFGRGSAEPTAGERSIGLGLPIARSLTTAHGGTLEVASTSGQGSTFTLSLPRTGQDPADG